ncbi:transposase [Hydrogenophaga palleronii]|uniref:Transposase n=1 Tax=Hydrogenophaga palleronii TaxID=65655 RepID=A0ABU1WMW5_9BURK|nr:IS630 family transposase [Hydrogenophaga palleronii]MDR7150640.1 transposase [Hydrogenophaga palleronii]
MRVAEAIELDAQTERGLHVLSKGRRVEARVQQRASVILLAAQGWQNKDIAEEVRLDRRQVALWRRRFIEGGIQALLQDAARSGRTPSVTRALESLILSRTLHEQPTAGAHWSTRTLASHLGLSATTIRRVWQRNGIQPHLQDLLKVSPDPSRVENMLVDVVGLHMSPFVHAMVFSCDEKGPVQAVTRTAAPHLRHGGTTTLLAALNALHALDGAVISKSRGRHRQAEWLKFLRQIHRRTPKHIKLHLIVDNDATQRYPEVQAWLAEHPRWVTHPAPGNTSWLNRTKRFLRDELAHRIRRDSFPSLGELQQATAQYIELPTKTPKPFIWTASALANTKRTRAAPALPPITK